MNMNMNIIKNMKNIVLTIAYSRSIAVSRSYSTLKTEDPMKKLKG